MAEMANRSTRFELSATDEISCLTLHDVPQKWQLIGTVKCFEVSATDEVIDFVLDAHDAFFGNYLTLTHSSLTLTLSHAYLPCFNCHHSWC